VCVLGGEADLDSIASGLYAAFRALDAAGVAMIFARGYGRAAGLGAAIADRMRRAAAGRVVRC
jgi:hypothetical protein